MYQNYILLKVFIYKNLVLPPVCGGVFVHSASWESYVTRMRPTGVVAWGEGSHREPSLLPIGLGVLYDSQSNGYALFFIAIRNRVNNMHNSQHKRITNCYLNSDIINIEK